MSIIDDKRTVYFCVVSELGALQRKKNSKNPRLLWKWVGGSRSHSEFFVCGKSSQNSPKPVLKFGVVYHV